MTIKIIKIIKSILSGASLLLLAACATKAPPDAEPVQPRTAVIQPVRPAERVPAPAPPVLSATDRQIATLRSWVTQHDRLYAIAAPLLINNTALCKRQARSLAGFTAKTRYSYSKEFIGAAQAAFGLGEQLRVMNVLPGSGAARSGLRQGDVLLAVQDKPMPMGPNAERDAAAVVGSAMQDRASLNLTVLRDGARLAVEVPLTRACAFAIELGNADYVNSYADGQQVMITRGMLEFARSDEEVAYVLAKEIAHASLIQGPRPAMRNTINSLRLFRDSDGRPGADAFKPALKPYSPVLDSTADKVALYMLANAGYNIDNVLGFWKRLAGQYPATVRDSHTALHPATAFRFSVISAVVPAVKSKQANSLPLVP